MTPTVQDKGQDKELKIRRAKSSDVLRIAVLSGELGYPATAAQMRERLNPAKTE